MSPSPSKRTSVWTIGRTSPFYHRNGLCAVPPADETARPVEWEKHPLFIVGNGTQAVPGDEGDDAIQRAAQVSNLCGGLAAASTGVGGLIQSPLKTSGYEKSPAYWRDFFVLALPIFPASRPASIVGAVELNFCVRDGNRWTLIAINTNFFGWV